MLTLAHIDYHHGKQALLRDINLSLEAGRITGLLGVNGAGKSTTLKIAAGILRPDNGHISRSPDWRLGYVPEVPPLMPAWSVRRFLTHACSLQAIARKHHAAAIDRVIELCKLHAIINKPCAALSKGNQQRLSIAQALIHQPNILILDEPTSGLDPQQIRQFRLLLKTLKAETAIVLSSHIMQEITALCDTAMVIHEGRQVGELDLSERNNRVLIEFAAPVEPALFAKHPAWLSGEGRRHQFRLDTTHDKNRLLQDCLDKQLPIARLVGIEDALEREFLALIGHEVAHA